MNPVRGRVQGGRLKADEGTALPDDRDAELAPVPDEGDDLDDEDRARLHAALRESRAQMERGQVHPLERVLAEM